MDLVISGLTKTYPNGVHALKGVNLTVRPGMFGLLGPNGAGKSSLMRTIATLQDADAGTITFGDIDVLSDKQAVRRTLGYLPQEFGLYPAAKAYALLDHFAVLKGITSRSERASVCEALLHQTNLWDARKKAVGTFSGGMRQRFGIAIAMLGKPKLIVVDEPTAGLDPAERVRFLNLLSEIGEQSVVILSTHIVEDVADLCHAMAVIDQGQILLSASPDGAKATLRGKVHRCIVDKGQVAEVQAAHVVLSTRLLAGRIAVRVFAPAAPPGFDTVEPDLEDVYFAAMKRVGGPG
jgi:ABC-type multidrug transport system ATPase subunit